MVQIFGILVAEIIIGVLCVCLTLIWSARIMSDALARLTASVAAIGADVAGIADAIRNHINGDSGISQTALNYLADQLDEAGAKLKGLETDLGPAGEPVPPAEPAISEPAPSVPETPPITEPAPPVPDNGTFGDEQPQPALAPTSDLPPAGNQNGVGSEFADGEPPASDVPPADGLGEPAAPPADQSSDTPPTDDGSPIE